jgi:hypothetical protein
MNRSLGSALVLAVVEMGCADARCEPKPVGAPWKEYESRLPDKVVVCGPNRVNSKKPFGAKDDNPPSQVFVFFEEKNAAPAFRSTVDKFEAAGWKFVSDTKFAEDLGSYSGKATKGAIQISVQINRNDWGTQGSFLLVDVSKE